MAREDMYTMGVPTSDVLQNGHVVKMLSKYLYLYPQTWEALSLGQGSLLW